MKDLNDIVKERFLKNTCDKILAVVLLILSWPVFLLIAFLSMLNGVLIKDDRGPVFFKIERISKGKVIALIKFRTIKMKKLQEILDREGRIDNIKSLEVHDYNLTLLGRILRDFYLDELPQILNVLKSEISFVGPRPYPLSMYEEEIAKGGLRKKIIRAGLTGLVQVNKGIVNSKEKEIALDLEYISKVRTLSPFKLLVYDLGIIIKSFWIVAKGQGL